MKELRKRLNNITKDDSYETSLASKKVYQNVDDHQEMELKLQFIMWTIIVMKNDAFKFLEMLLVASQSGRGAGREKGGGEE